ncbi:MULTISPECIES: Lrp/AsnC family transcriptional regulator [Phyllobacteriaceae]|jgi:Lrp/AsnC family transcriptional regulator, leucine-responsive regulatory protein|uniref:AsnC family transcriptional regulator n=2 Tax=Pseudomonadota TaxID=1224 RepID=A0A1C2DE15_9HYPH|nr:MULTISPECIES: Lrp/AsnC family transcriptional regulator [Mesorhizobium]MBN9232917.1 Lrp/AsnC family transcriptional regulator [Mesorhizobium sp.]MDQ0330521.1 DNA-binding Lrp family transcriptional regulator [Mesorhizobium sp. YL-MeA3-2017]OCX13009.1 AsnC family transcriptional regulator [Mesorhizobium hungaricum]
MDEETDGIRQNIIPERDLDDMDRKLLGALCEDATVSYAELGEKVGLSAPAAHERVKRLRRSRAIRSTSVLIDPVAVNKPLLAFVHVDTRGWGKTPELMAISAYPEVEEIHSVAGDACMLLKVRARDTYALEGLLARLYDTPGVIATRSYVVLSTYLERPVQPGTTKVWPMPRHMARPIEHRGSVNTISKVDTN